MLDDVVDKEAGPKPKLVTPTASVGSAVRHIAPDELDAYISGRLAGARLDLVRNHLDACEECRAALEDLRTFKASAVGLSQASSLKRELERRQRQRQLKTAATALVAAAVVAAVGMVGWNRFGKAWVHSATTAFAHPSASTPAATTQAATATAAPPKAVAPPAPQPAPASDTRVAAAAPHATPVAQSRAAVASAQTVSTQAVQSRGAMSTASTAPQSRGGVAQSPAQIAAASQVAMQARGGLAQSAALARGSGSAQSHGGMSAAPAEAAAGSTSFALLGPFGDEVTDDRPEFAWQPLAGATKYSIIIVDEGLRPIAHTRLKTTTWRPKKPLRRGRSYLWQVTAVLKNGTKVMATGPTSQEARIHITFPGK